MKTKWTIILAVLSCIMLEAVQAQGLPLNRMRSVGLLIDYPVSGYTLPEQTTDYYKPLLVQVNFRFPLIQNNGLHQATLYVTPQFDPVLPMEGFDPNKFLFEGGVNLGVAYEYYIPNAAILFFGGSIGPHYINIETNRQANGFIFSDNIFAGVHQILSSKWMMTYQGKFRHISNAGLQHPNGGINNWFVGMGLSYFF